MEMQSLCSLRSIFHIIRSFELQFQKEHGLCLNEGMLLCSLKESKYTSGEIAEMLGLSNSNASKVIGSVEDKGLVKRIPGKQDKRQMYFVITKEGLNKLAEIKCENNTINKLLADIQSQIR